MTIKNVSSIDDLQNDGGKEITVVHFHTEWCDESRYIGNILEAISSNEEFSNINFMKCAAENFPNISTEFNVTAVPTILFFKNGRQVDELTGADPVLLNNKLQKYIEPKLDDTISPTIIKSGSVVVCLKEESTDHNLNKELTNILENYKVKFKTYNILTDDTVKKQLIKFSGSSSFPQLYIKGEFVGEIETVKHLNSTGELSAWIDAVSKNLDKSLVYRLISLIKKSSIMVFMKGEKNAPRCGFSKQLMEILKETNLPFDTFDILTDEDVRQGLKIYSNWPTYPQVYVNGELVGGLDIIKSLKEEGELITTLKG